MPFRFAISLAALGGAMALILSDGLDGAVFADASSVAGSKGGDTSTADEPDEGSQ